MTDEISDEALMAEIERLAAELGEPPSARQMDDRGEYWCRTYQLRFGSWNAAIEAAGLIPKARGTPIPETELLAEIERLANEHGRAPTAREMEDDGAYSSSTYQRRFESWSAAVDSALE